MVCTSLGSLVRPLFHFLCSNLKANPVELADEGVPGYWTAGHNT